MMWPSVKLCSGTGARYGNDPGPGACFHPVGNISKNKNDFHCSWSSFSRIRHPFWDSQEPESLNHPEKTVAGTTAKDVETPMGLLQVLILRVVRHKVFCVNKSDLPAFSGAEPSSPRMPHLAFPGDSYTTASWGDSMGGMPLGRGRTRALVRDFDEVFIPPHQPGQADEWSIADLPPASNGPETINTIDLQTGCKLSPFLDGLREGHWGKNIDRQTPREESD